MSTRATAERYAPRLGLAGSVALHAAIVAGMLVTWTHTLDIADLSSPVVPVDLVTIGEKTNIAPMVKQEEQQTPKPDEVPPPPQPTPAPPQPEELAPSPLAKAVPVPKPQPAPKKEAFDINNIVALLDKRKAAATAPPGAKIGPQTIKGIGAQNAMTADLKTLLQSEIYRCWSPPVGAPDAKDMVVSFALSLNPDGSVSQPPQLTANSAAAAAGNAYVRAAAEAARRAIYTCAPYRLPADRYGQWRSVTFTFDPRDMMGQ